MSAPSPGSVAIRPEWAARGALLFSVMVALAFSQNLLAILLSPYSFTLARAVLVAKEGYIAGILLLGVLVAAAALVRGEIPVHAPILAICGIIGALALCAIVSPAFNTHSRAQIPRRS